ncbi:MAG: helix-turn-helix transcriptional regulator [Gemmatimonadaceae bacterium]|nr:helix-turn-helix transcriptional regulator [Gemmatimonadaceae bacterium]
MNRHALILETPAVSLAAFDHPHGVAHTDPDVECTRRHAVAFVDEGSFDVVMGRDRWRLGPGSLFLTTPGMTFSVRHDCDTPTDRCLSLSFSEHAWEHLRSAGVPELAPPHGVVDNRRAFVRRRLATCAPGQEMRLELLAASLVDSFGDVPAPRRRASNATAMARQLDRAVELIDTSYASALTLDALAKAAHMSPFHFARMFREQVGMPPHRYLMTVRLREAVRLLEQGASVSDACYRVGFASLSHFVTMFRERFGVVPSRANRATLRAMALPRWARR